MTPHEYLNSFTNFESQLHKLSGSEFDLARVKELLDLLGSPQKSLKIVHVAGTKGKGSTCAFMAHILAEAGYRAGLYTSPHLHRVNERIRILDKAAIAAAEDFSGSITDGQLAEIVHDVRGPIANLLNRGVLLTYFEVLTVAALVFFHRQKVDCVVLETGLGGRLDATNAAESTIAVITPISLDHVNILGKTVEAIAKEKAGIIKSSKQRVVLAPQPPEIMEVLKQRCAEFGIAPTVADEEKIRNVKVSLKGAHQRVNAAIAVEAVAHLRSLGYKIEDEAIGRGLSSTRWPARFEIVHERPTVVIDGAHNAASAKALAQTLTEEFPGRRIILVLGCSSDKDVQAIVRELKLVAQTIIWAKADHPRSHPFAGALSVPQAMEQAFSKAKPEDIIVVAGSLFVAAEAHKEIE